jgi:hypothetical protein
MARQNLTEAGAHTQILEANSDGSLLIQVITPGWGSSGYYSPQVLEAAGKNRVWPAGTHMYFDHPSASEASNRPERSVKDLAATLTEDARWDGERLVARAEPVGLGKTVLADEAFRKAVACSVRASAEMNMGEAAGRKGWVVEKILPDTFNSVDFVTHAGRGGMILESARAAVDADVPAVFLRESAIAKIREARNIGQWIESRLHLELTQLADDMYGDGDGRLTRDERISLSSAVGDALTAFAGDLEKSAPQLYQRDLWADPEELAMAAEAIRPARETPAADTDQALSDAVGQAYSDRDSDTYAWVRDFDPDQKVAWFELSVAGACTTYQQSYSVADNGEIELTGDKTEVVRRTTYTPVAAESAASTNVPAPAGQSTTIQESQEDTMPEIEEARQRELEEAAGRVPVLEAKLATETERADSAEQALAVEKAKVYARDFGTKRVREANSELAAPVVEKIVAEAMREIPLTEADNAADRRLDTEAFGKRVDEARKDEETYLASIVQPGHVRGVGITNSQPSITESDLDSIVAGAFGRPVKGA